MAIIYYGVCEAPIEAENHTVQCNARVMYQISGATRVDRCEAHQGA